MQQNKTERHLYAIYAFFFNKLFCFCRFVVTDVYDMMYTIKLVCIYIYIYIYIYRLAFPLDSLSAIISYHYLIIKKKKKKKKNVPSENAKLMVLHSKKNAGLKTTQFGLFGNPALGKYWTEYMLGYFDPSGWVKCF